MESKHEYLPNMHEDAVLSIPKAKRLRFKFDPQTKTENGCDWLRFYRDAGRSHEITELTVTGTTFPKEPITIDAGTIYTRFHSDGSCQYWGYKFEVLALPAWRALASVDAPLHRAGAANGGLL